MAASTGPNTSSCASGGHRHVAQQHRGLVEAGGGRLVHHLALGHHRMPPAARPLQEVPHALLLALADQRADVQVHGGRADAQGAKAWPRRSSSGS
jgi:hypothetical protein